MKHFQEIGSEHRACLNIYCSWWILDFICSISSWSFSLWSNRFSISRSNLLLSFFSTCKCISSILSLMHVLDDSLFRFGAVATSDVVAVMLWIAEGRTWEVIFGIAVGSCGWGCGGSPELLFSFKTSSVTSSSFGKVSANVEITIGSTAMVIGSAPKIFPHYY